MGPDSDAGSHEHGSGYTDMDTGVDITDTHIVMNLNPDSDTEIDTHIRQYTDTQAHRETCTH